ncbi:MAG: DUF2255 family protein [Caulobacterales bacterium]|nr:DUF2255 family protein [Caulobacterales bacterium]
MSDTGRTFDDAFLEAIETKELIGVRGGAGEHRFLPIWMVAVDRRVFARSWSRLQRSWRTAFDEEGVGVIDTGDIKMAVKGAPVTDAALNARIDDAYRLKYGDQQGVRDIVRPVSVVTTIEFLPSVGNG